jgi:hypothetical protein
MVIPYFIDQAWRSEIIIGPGKTTRPFSYFSKKRERGYCFRKKLHLHSYPLDPLSYPFYQPTIHPFSSEATIP